MCLSWQPQFSGPLSGLQKAFWSCAISVICADIRSHTQVRSRWRSIWNSVSLEECVSSDNSLPYQGGKEWHTGTLELQEPLSPLAENPHTQVGLHTAHTSTPKRLWCLDHMVSLAMSSWVCGWWSLYQTGFLIHVHTITQHLLLPTGSSYSWKHFMSLKTWNTPQGVHNSYWSLVFLAENNLSLGKDHPLVAQA